jgi:hypothetical protein
MSVQYTTPTSPDTGLAPLDGIDEYLETKYISIPVRNPHPPPPQPERRPLPVSTTYVVDVIAGDGIGQEVMPAGIACVEAIALAFDFALILAASRLGIGAVPADRPNDARRRDRTARRRRRNLAGRGRRR